MLRLHRCKCSPLVFCFPRLPIQPPLTHILPLFAKHSQVAKLSEEEISGGFSGAELIAVCKDAALLALEEDDSNPTSHELPSIKMRHLLKAIQGMQRQITPEMIEFYETFRRSESR